MRQSSRLARPRDHLRRLLITCRSFEDTKHNFSKGKVGGEEGGEGGEVGSGEGEGVEGGEEKKGEKGEKYEKREGT